MTKALQEYLSNINEVSHFTFDPKGPGVVRIHLIPPKKVTLGISWVVIINGYDVLPITCGWAILLREFFSCAIEYEGKILDSEAIITIIEKTICKLTVLFPKTKKEMFKEDLNDIVSTFQDIARGKTPTEKIGYMTLSKYAKYMTAPHRMDLMISSMEMNGQWNCNQKCLHCYANTQPLAITTEIDTSEWKKIIDKCKEARISQLTFTGGEPTLRKDLVELVNYSSWFITRLNTNGIKLSKELASQLYDASLDSVQITLYSSDSKIHNLLVGSNHFEETVNGIKNALSAGLNVSINTPLCNINKNYLETIKFAQELGVSYFSCSGLIMSGASNTRDARETYLEKEELLNILKEATSYCHENELEIAFTSPGWIEEKELKRMQLIVPSCGACLSNMAISPSGDVIPCQSWLSCKSLGNLLEQNFKDIWNSKRCKKIRKQSSKKTQTCLLAKGVNNKNEEI